MFDLDATELHVENGLGGLEPLFMDEHKHEERLVLASGTLQRAALELLWISADISVWEVVDKLSEKLGLDLQYTTISSTLNRLCDMGFATRVRKPGARAYRYWARVSREQVERAATLEAVQKVFQESGNSRMALSYLIDIVKRADSRLLSDLEAVVEQKLQDLKPRGK